MSAGIFELTRHIHVILQIVFFVCEDVARVANGCFCNTRRTFANGFNWHFHRINPVQGIENTEDINSGFRGFLHEFFNQIVWVSRIAYRVWAAEKHLQQHVGHGFAEFLQTFPRRFLQETHGHVESRTTPNLHREQLREGFRKSVSYS